MRRPRTLASLRPRRVAAALLGLALGLGAGGPPRGARGAPGQGQVGAAPGPAGQAQSDDDSDEQDLQAIKGAIAADRPPLPRLPPPPPPTAALVRPTDWLPELGAIAELLLAYTVEPRDIARDRDVTALQEAPPTGALPPPGAVLRIELSLHKVVEGYFRVDAFALLGTGGGLSLLEASASTLTLPFRLQLRGGLLLHRFGVQNSWHPHALSLLGRPLSVERAFGPGGGGLGVEASWQPPLPWLAQLSAAVLSAIGQGSFYGDRPPEGPVSFWDLVYVLTLKQYTPVGRRLSGSVGLSVALGPNPTGRSNRSDVYGVDLALRLRGRGGLRADLLSEWLWRRRQVPGGLLQDVSGYGELGLRPPPGRVELRLRLRYEYGGPVLDDLLWTRERHRLVLGADLALGRAAVLRLSGLLDLAEGAGAASPAAAGVAGYGCMGALQLRLGQHGLREADLHGLQL